MIRTFGNHKLYVVVLSTQRPQNVAMMTMKIGSATWCVPRGEVDAYRSEGAKHFITDGGGNVASARNVALHHARKLKLPCLQMDDDLISMKLANDGRARPIRFPAAAVLMANLLEATPFKLAASNIVTNAIYVKHPVTQNKTINGGMLLILPTKLSFDPEQQVSEDIDYALRHHEVYGGYLRIDCLMTAFRHRQAGGVQVYRDREWDRRGTEMLKRKWGDKVRDRQSKDNPYHVLVNL
jgi:hypothetical protein